MRPIILIESLCIDLVRVKCRNISETKAQSNIAVDKLDKTANPSKSDRLLVDGESPLDTSIANLTKEPYPLKRRPTGGLIQLIGID